MNPFFHCARDPQYRAKKRFEYVGLDRWVEPFPRIWMPPA